MLKAQGEAVHNAPLRQLSHRAQPLRMAGLEVTLPGRLYWPTADRFLRTVTEYRTTRELLVVAGQLEKLREIP